ncbi:hypothetical protein CDAR_445451 [Caerostris darwini]|uniref:Uncharacterized protein n=1 Tax=Caerostris darwini TaxID=1538125 RepID=A0AAV4SDW3_9ARAC|nr:hypothetical protein CDAR_445451 [Caerostris darwini]
MHTTVIKQSHLRDHPSNRCSNPHSPFSSLSGTNDAGVEIFARPFLFKEFKKLFPDLIRNVATSQGRLQKEEIWGKIFSRGFSNRWTPRRQVMISPRNHNRLSALLLEHPPPPPF